MRFNRNFIITASVIITTLTLSIAFYIVKEVLSDVLKYRTEQELAASSTNLTEPNKSETPSANDANDAVENDMEPDEFGIYIVGEIQTPGFYLLPAGSRINDAIDASGGVTDDADLNAINSAQYVYDQQKIVIPSKSDPAAYASHDESITTNNNTEQPISQANVAKQAIVDGIVNINIASLDDLCTLPGIGVVTAQAIIDFREKNGPFTLKTDIKDVRRIGDKTYEAIEHLISIK